MPASDVRRGSGWWMDLDGAWNPPELWPESTPPLPGWSRAADGSWVAPVEEPSDDEEIVDEPNAALTTNAAETLASPEPAASSQIRLVGYADSVPPAPPHERYEPSVEAALAAAAAAAITAVAIAIGLILLIMVL